MLTGWSATFVRSVIALLLVPFLLKRLGQDGYGLVGLLGVIMGFASVADLGLSTALGRELAERKTRNDIRGFHETASTALLLYVILSIIVASAFFLLAPWLADTFKIPGHFRADAIFLIRTCGVASIILSCISPVFSAGLASFMRFDTLNILGICSGLVSSLLHFLLLTYLPWNPVYISMWIGLGLAGGNTVLFWFFYRKSCFGGELGWQYVNASRLKPLFGVGAYMYISQIANTISEQSDPLVISYFLGPAKVALYQPGTKLSLMTSPVILTLSTQLHPYTTQLHVEKDQEKMRQVLLLNTRFTLLLGSLASGGLFIFAEPFCRIWLSGTLGANYHVVVQVMQCYAMLDFLGYCGSSQWPVLLGMKKLDFILWNNVPAAILNIALSIYFVGFTSLGVPGVLLGSVIAKLVRMIRLVFYTPQLCGVTTWGYLKESYAAPAVCMAWVLATGSLLQTHIPCQGWFIMASLAAATALIWLIPAVSLGIKKEERLRIWQFIQARLNAT